MYTDTQIEDLDKKTEQIFREGISTATSDDSDSDGSCIEYSQSSHVVTQHWDKYIQWCKERVEDTASSDRLKKKVMWTFKVEPFNIYSCCIYY